MRTLKLNTWTAKTSDGDKTESLADIISAILNNIPPQETPRSYDKFKLFNNINKAFIKAEETSELKLEETEYEFLQDLINRYIPSTWGLNKNYSQAVQDFMEIPQD